MSTLKIILSIKTINYRKKSFVIINLNNGKSVFLTMGQIIQNVPSLQINELEILTGSKVRIDFFKVGDEMRSGNICNKDEEYVKEYFIKLEEPIDILREKKQYSILPFLMIEKIFYYEKNGKMLPGIKTYGSDRTIFLNEGRLEKVSGLEKDEQHILNRSFIYVDYYKIGDDLGKSGKVYTNNLVKTIIIRYRGTVNQMHEWFENEVIPERLDNYFDDGRPDRPYYEEMGYDSWDDMIFHDVFDGEIDAWNSYND